MKSLKKIGKAIWKAYIESIERQYKPYINSLSK